MSFSALGRRRAQGDRDAEVLRWLCGYIEARLVWEAALAQARPGPAPAEPPAAKPLRISAGRAAAAAGLHPYADAGELFLELLYQDLPELLLRDAAVAGVEVISAAAERERLLTKSGQAEALGAALQRGGAALGVEGVRSARDDVAAAVEAARTAECLTAEEAQELRRLLELDLNLEFGARHEDAALASYEAHVGARTFGQQHRLKVPMPPGGAAEALAHVFPATGTGSKASIEKTQVPAAEHLGGPVAAKPYVEPEREAYFYLTGFTDAIVDLPTNVDAACGAAPLETLVVEVKHRMGKLQETPNLYDVVQLCCYCRVLGCARGDLVQCLRHSFDVERGGVAELRVTRLDFSEGSTHRRGWDEHVLPGLYEVTRAVYAARADEGTRLRLLAAPDAAARLALVGTLCPHLER